ncbi:MAG: carboxypeptidase-like regulatory domain-containing protein [Chitinophagaceae bacterium]|nr:MAG: carboxypeptidase-like regulatory domain-containing protein [Chitinophagaceae bacterium]
MSPSTKLIPLVLALTLITLPALSQKVFTGIVKDAQSEEPVPFASISFIGTSMGKLTDSSGAFTFYLDKWPSDSLVITSVGYQPYRFSIDISQDSIIAEIPMERGTFNEGVRVKAKVNKGLLLWRKIVQNKNRNDRYRFDNFSYELYNKLEVDVKNVNFKRITRFKPLRSVGQLITPHMDSTENAKYLPTYLTEALSDYFFQKKPTKRREVIRAANTNGIKNESFVKYLGGMDQNINIYNNFLNVFDKQFVSPASDNGDIYYNYQVLDTQQVGSHRIYHLVFTPRRQGTNTFEGDCWVVAGSFAIQKMNLRLGASANVNFVENLSLIQEYSLINDSTWFLSKDKFVVDISPIGKNSPGVIGRKTTTYRNVVVNDTSVTSELAKNKVMEEVITLTGANEKDKNFWTDSRHEELSKSEAGIIQMIDTLMNAPSFQQLTRRIDFLATGYVDVGNVKLGQWYNWVTANSWEGFRVRFDVGSNKKFDKHWWYHTYLAYGFGDRKLKGKAELFYLPNKHPRRYWYGSYTNDLDFGQSYYGEVTQDNVFALAIRKQNVPLKFIKVDEKRFEFFNEHRIGLSELIAVTHKAFTPLRNIPLKDSFPVVANNGTPLTSFEISVRLRFAYLEKFLENTFFRSSLGSPYPIGELYLSRGIAGVFKSSYNYTKLSGSVSDYIKVPPFGSISYQVYAGRTFGTIPYVLLDIAPGNELYYYNKYAFNMMNRYEFIHDRFMGINWEHNIGNGIFRLFPKLKFRQFYTVKTLWGSLSDANRAYNFKQGNSFQSLDGKTYMEIGTGVDNILRVFRVDFIWRVLPNRLAEGSQTARFGVFGSFRLAF